MSEQKKCSFCLQTRRPCLCQEDADKLKPELLRLAARGGMQPVLLALRDIWAEKMMDTGMPAAPEPLWTSAASLIASIDLVLLSHLRFIVALGDAVGLDLKEKGESGKGVVH